LCTELPYAVLARNTRHAMKTDEKKPPFDEAGFAFHERRDAAPDRCCADGSAA